MTLWHILTDTHFHLEIGDPTILGWLTVGLYLLAALLCGYTAWRAGGVFPGTNHRAHRLIWAALAVVLLFLAVNKQLDLQSWLSAVGRAAVYESGWYEQRDTLQMVLILVFVAGSLGILFAAGWLVRRAWRQYWMLLLGSVFLVRFIMVRAASFWGITLPELSRFTGGIRVNTWLELTGAGVISLAAFLNLRRAGLFSKPALVDEHHGTAG